MTSEELDALLSRLRTRSRQATLDLGSFGPLNWDGVRRLADNSRNLKRFSGMILEVGEDEEGDDPAELLCDVLKSLTHLHSFELTLSVSSVTAARAIAGHLGKLRSLRCLRLEVSSDDESRCSQVMAEAIARLPRLQDLALRGSELDESGLRALLQSSTLSTLRSLDLRDNLLEGRQGVRPLTQVAGSITALESLDLSHNELSDSGAEAVASLRAKLPSLKSLNVEAAGISANGLYALLRAILDEPWSSSLTNLHLQENKFDGVLLELRGHSGDAEAWREYARKKFAPVQSPTVAEPALLEAPASACEKPPKQRQPSRDAMILFEVLAEIRHQVEVDKQPAELAWLSKKELFAKTGGNRRRKDADALLGELVAAKLIEDGYRGPTQTIRVYRALA